MLVVLIIVASLIVLVLIVWAVLFLIVNNPGIPRQGSKKSIPEPRVVLGVFAHPDDEIMAAGTFARWQKKGATIHLFYYTHGEDGPTGGIVDKSDLGPTRAKELEDVQKILGAQSLTILDYPDRYLSTIPSETLIAELKPVIERLQPDTVVCFDKTVGLYGNPDHAYAGYCCQTLLEQTPCGVRYQLVMTLCSRMLALALKMSTTFRERYRAENGLPPATLAVPIRRTGGQKKQVALAHKTQHEVVEDVQPFLMEVPAFIYYRIFSREYFSVTELPHNEA